MGALGELPAELCAMVLQNIAGTGKEPQLDVILDPGRVLAVKSLKALRLTDKRWAAMAKPFLFSRIQSAGSIIRPSCQAPLPTQAALHLRIDATPTEPGCQPISQLVLLPLPVLRSLELTGLRADMFIHLVAALYSIITVRELMLGFCNSSSPQGPPVRAPRPSEALLPFVRNLVVVFDGQSQGYHGLLDPLLMWLPRLRELEFLGSLEERSRHPALGHVFFDLKQMLPPVKDTLEILRLRGSAYGSAYRLDFSDYPQLRHLHVPAWTAEGWLAYNVWPRKLHSLTIETGRGRSRINVGRRRPIDETVLRTIKTRLADRFECGLVRYVCPLGRQRCHCGLEHGTGGRSLKKHYEVEFEKEGVRFEMASFHPSAWALQVTPSHSSA